MKLGAIPENIVERIALWLGLAPTPLVDTHLAFMMARTVMTAVKGNLFECLAREPLTADQVASRSENNPKATEKLLRTLVHLGYVKSDGNRYALTSLSRKWMLRDSPQSLYHKMLFHFAEWEIVEQYDRYLKTGAPLDIHDSFFNDRQWELYQRAMRDLAHAASREIAAVTPVPHHATQLLDIGGAHGYHAAAICGKHPRLHATILELPQAIPSAGEMLANEKTGRVRHLAGNILTHDLGEAAWDVVLIANLAHHFDDETNRMIARKASAALRPGGYYIILDFIRDERLRRGDHLGALMDLYFSATSRGGTFSLKEIKQWQEAAALKPIKTVWLRTVPRHALQVAVKAGK